MIRLATRSSAQARTQAQVVANAISTATGEQTELVFVETLGDITNRYSRLFWITAMSISSPSVCSGEKKSLQKCNDRLILPSVFRLQLCRLHSV